MHAPNEISFGKFRLDLINECLWQGTRAISLRPKAFAVLKLLVESPGILVTKQQVLDRVWPGIFVGDAVLKDSIRQLREALKDDAGSPVYIETAHRRGYRFIGKISEPSMIGGFVAAKHTNTPQLAPKVSAFPRSARASGLLGRDPELAKLRLWLDQALAGQRQTLFVTGEPGIGKTSLVHGLLEQVAQVPGVRVAHGQCLEHYGAGEAYLPVLDGFSRLCRTVDGREVLNVLRHRAPAWLAQMPSLVPPTEREHLQSQAGETTRERMLREMAEAIDIITVESPLLLVLEDLHWSDYSTLDLVSYLARRKDPARLMVIGTYRPVEVVLADHPLKGVKRELQAHRLCHEVALECLPEKYVADYLTARFPGHQFPPWLRKTIYKQTEGNPLFMVNLVEYLVDQNMIFEEQRQWRLCADLAEVEREVPVNLRQLIEKQIERLSPEERTVLEAASVAGMECSTLAIAAGLDMPAEWVEKHCEELARRHQFLSAAWLAELPDGMVTPRHRFIHVLYREVPYRLMSPMRRSQIHQRIAQRGIAIYGDRASEIAAELAMHFEQSHDWSRALEYLLLAAENAATCSAHHEAIELANRGLEVLKLLPEAAEHAKQEMKLLMILSVSLAAIKGFASPEVERINSRGHELFWRNGPSPELFYMLWSLNLYRQFSGDLRSSLETSFQLMSLAKDLKDEALIMDAHRSIGAVLVLSGRCSEALEHLNKGSALYATQRNRYKRVFVNFDSKVMFDCFAAHALLELGYLDQSAERLAEALTLAKELGHPQTLVVSGRVAAQLHQMRGEASLAYQHAKEALELADHHGMEVWRAYGLIELGWSEAELGNVREGIEKMQRGLAEYQATGAKLRRPYFLGLLADQLGKAGRAEDGLLAITDALGLAELTGEAYFLAELHRIKGELFIKAGEINRSDKLLEDSQRSRGRSQARACFADALLIAKQRGAKLWELRAALSMHRLDLMVGSADTTRLAEIYSSFTEGFETPDLKQARAQLRAISC